MFNKNFESGVLSSPDKDGGSSSRADSAKENFPTYEEKFGHLAEKIIRSALGKRDVFVEKIEQGTRQEDYRQKVDFWIQLKDMIEPIGIQFTTNPKKYEEKKEYLRRRNFIAKKEKRVDSEIDWSGNANVVVILGDHAKMLGYWKKIEQEGAKPEDIVSDAFIVDFFRQLLIEFDEANPPMKRMIMENIITAAKKQQQNKKAGKR